MQAVKNKGSEIERILSKALWNRGLRFRKNVTSVTGKPDFALKKYKVAVFADSEFWHGKNWDQKKHEHKSNKKFWHQKIERNIERDREVNEVLQRKGWKVLRFWGNEIKKDPEACAEKVENTVREVRERLKQ